MSKKSTNKLTENKLAESNVTKNELLKENNIQKDFSSSKENLVKNQEIIVEIIDNGVDGEGIAKIDNFPIFIPNTIKGEKVKIKILKVLKSYAFGKVSEILEKSELRAEVDCKTYPRCGGCNLRHCNYETTISMKKNSVQNTLTKALGRKVEINEVLKMDEPYYYRNKLQYPIGIDKNSNIVMGVYAERSHFIIPTNQCKIQDKFCQKVANFIFDFVKENNIQVYNEQTLKGSLRHIIVRIGKKTKEVMVTLVTNTNEIPKEKELVSKITENFPEVKTIIKNINNKNTNVILGDKNIVLFGEGYIYDYLGNKKFKISPMSFYQVNPIQTEKLYSKAVEYANLSGKETIFDLYCGIGTIGIFASDNVKKIYGIETIKEAIEDAKENAKLNNIENSEFYSGDVEKILPELIKDKNISADVIFIDPPRKGCDKVAIDTILKIAPEKIVYVSCNPATLGRDIKLLEEKYTLNKISICDMFCFTRSHRKCSNARKK